VARTQSTRRHCGNKEDRAARCARHEFSPLALGVGKVWTTVDGVTLNLFVEPQGTVAPEGVAPELQVFMGFNLQFPLGH
jgi:hypothetical protein